MKYLLFLGLLAVSLNAQRTTKLEVFSGGAKKIELNGDGVSLFGAGVFVKDTGVDIMELVGDHLTMRTPTSVSRVEIGGYDGVGPVFSYGGRLRLNTIAGASKFAVGHGDSAKADALNGYSVGGLEAIDASRNFTGAAYYVENSGVDIMELSGDHLTLRNTSSISRVELGGYDGGGPLALYGGRLRLMTIGGASKFGVGHGDSAQADALNGFAVGGSSVITSGRIGLFPQLGTISDHVTTMYGEVINVYASGRADICGGGLMYPGGLNWYTSIGSGCSSVIAFAVAGSNGFLNVSGPSFNTTLDSNGITTTKIRLKDSPTPGHVWTATDFLGNGSWQAPVGGGSNITTNTPQSGMFGPKQTSGDWTWGASGGQRTDISGSGGSLLMYNSSGVNKVLISIGGSLPGVVRTFDSFGTTVNGFDGNGIFTNAGINVNGALGISRFCGPGETIRSPIHVFGVLISGTCGI